MSQSAPIHKAADALIRAAEEKFPPRSSRCLRCGFRETIDILGRMGAFARSEREVLHAAGLFPADDRS